MSSAIAKVKVRSPQSVVRRLVKDPRRGGFSHAARTALAGKGRSRSRDREIEEAAVCDGLCSSLQSLNGCTENRE